MMLTNPTQGLIVEEVKAELDAHTAKYRDAHRKQAKRVSAAATLHGPGSEQIAEQENILAAMEAWGKPHATYLRALLKVLESEAKKPK
jgi:hypothetical protein